jgi:hypothetical protein
VSSTLALGLTTAVTPMSTSGRPVPPAAQSLILRLDAKSELRR